MVLLICNQSYFKSYVSTMEQPEQKDSMIETPIEAIPPVSNNEKSIVDTCNDDKCIVDTCNGALVKEQSEAMRLKFDAAKQKFEKENIGETLYMCSIWFHDDMIVFEKHTESIWPMLSSLLTCGDLSEQKYRKLGVSKFLKKLFDVSKGHRFSSNIDKGIICSFEHPYNQKKMVTVFLQMRFVEFLCVPLKVVAEVTVPKIRSYTCTSCHQVCLERVVYLCERVNLHRKRKLDETVCQTHP